jgi:hypothetical protein
MTPRLPSRGWRLVLMMTAALGCAEPVWAQCPVDPAAKPTPWSVLVYASADDPDPDTGKALDADLAELAKHYSASVRVVAYVDRNGTQHTRQQLLSLERTGAAPAAWKTCASFPESNAGSTNILKRFLDWGRQVAPAEKTFVMLWGHGTGIADIIEWKRVKPRYPKGWIHTQGFGIDASSNDDLSVFELRTVLNSWKAATKDTVDILGFFSCYMLSVELAYELRDSAKFLIGAETTTPFSGWDLAGLIGSLERGDALAATASTIAAANAKRIDSLGREGPYVQAAVDQAGIAKVTAELTTLVTATAKMTGAQLSTLLSESGGTLVPQYLDLGNVARRARSFPGLQTVADNLLSALTASVVAAPSSRFKATGLSIYSGALSNAIPPADGYLVSFSDTQDYCKLAVPRLTGWYALNRRANPQAKPYCKP